MQKNWMTRLKSADAFKKRGTIYIVIATALLLYELLFSKPIRMTVVLLLIGVILIAFLVLTQLQDPNR